MLGRLRRALTLADSRIATGVPWPLAVVMASLGLAVAAHDAFGEVDYSSWASRLWPAGAALAVYYGCLRRHEAIGLRVRPLPSPGYWLRAVAWLAVLFGAILAVWFTVMLVLDEPLPPPERVNTFADVWDGCVYAPIVEETIYRWALVTGLVALVPRWAAVLVSGLVFAYIHKDVAAANNLSAGFVFAWMYLRSSSIAMPIAFHAIGNLAVIVGNTILFELA